MNRIREVSKGSSGRDITSTDRRNVRGEMGGLRVVFLRDRKGCRSRDYSQATFEARPGIGKCCGISVCPNGTSVARLSLEVNGDGVTEWVNE